MCAVAAACGLACAADLPRVDLHVHIDSHGAEPRISGPEAVALSQKLGVRFGIAIEASCDLAKERERILQDIAEIERLPLYRALQVVKPDWSKCTPKELVSRFDYVIGDALFFPGPGGKTLYLWTNPTVGDVQKFMDDYVAYNVEVLSQPISVWASPTYLPDALATAYDELWTPARMDRVIAAAVKNHVAIELNSRFKVPSTAFVRRAKAAGAKFSFGTNHHGHGIGEIDWSLATARECGLTAADIWLPKRKL